MRIFLQFLVFSLMALGGAYLIDRDPVALRDPETLTHIVLLAIILCAWLFGAPQGPRASMAQIAVNLVIWTTTFFGFAVAYDNRIEIHQAAMRTLSSFRPGHAVMLSEREAVLTRERSGHFTAYATINGKRVHMLVDTGSTDVALPFSDARRLGLDVDNLVFNRPVLTANGRAMVAQVTLDRIAVGGIELRNVPASVAQSDRLGGALLGMSYLGRLREFSFRGDKLILRE